jgi:hypothetical protein
VHKAKQLSNPSQAYVTSDEIITVPNEEVKETPCFMLSTGTKLKSARTAALEKIIGEMTDPWKKHCRCKINRTLKRLNEHLAGLNEKKMTRPWLCLGTYPHKMMSEYRGVVFQN